MLENRQGEYFIETKKKCVFVTCSERIYLSCLCVLNVLFIHLNTTKIWFTRQINAEWTEFSIWPFWILFNEHNSFFYGWILRTAMETKHNLVNIIKLFMYINPNRMEYNKKILTEMSTTTIKRILIIRLKLTKMPITTTTTNNQNMKNTSLNTRTKNKKWTSITSI